MRGNQQLAFYSKSHDYEIQKFRDVTKSHHELFMEMINAMKESLALKVAKIKSLMSEERKKMEENYKLLHGKVDVIVGAITRLVEFNNEYNKQLQAKSEKDENVFEKMEEFLSGIKEYLSKLDLSNKSTISQESLS